MKKSLTKKVAELIENRVGFFNDVLQKETLSKLCYDTAKLVIQTVRRAPTPRALDLASGSQNTLALLEECLANGKSGRDSLYAWFVGEKNLIEQTIKDARRFPPNQ